MDYNSKKQDISSTASEVGSMGVAKMKWSDRMNALVKDKGWTLTELSKRSGVDYESIAKYAKGEVDRPRGNTISKIAYALGVTEQNLLFGVALVHQLANHRSADTPKLHGTKRIPLVTLLELSNHQADSDLFSVWSGDRDIIVGDDVSSSCIAVQIADNSMLPGFAPGDTLLCDPDAAIEPGNFVIAKASGTSAAVFRKYRLVTMPAGGPRAELKPLNADYPSEFMDPEQLGHIIGRCVRVIKNI